MRNPEDWPEPGPFVGREAVIRQFQQARETWDAETLEPTGDFIHAADRVAVRATWRGAGYGPDLDIELTIVCTVRKGGVIYQEFFWDHAEALETFPVPVLLWHGGHGYGCVPSRADACRSDPSAPTRSSGISALHKSS